MGEYIERKKAIDAIVKAVDTGFAVTAEDLVGILDDLPAADVEPVVHGHPVEKLRHRGGFVRRTGWDNMGELHAITCDERYTERSLYCPVCGKLMGGEFLHYCDNCGAKMDGDRR